MRTKINTKNKNNEFEKITFVQEIVLKNIKADGTCYTGHNITNVTTAVGTGNGARDLTTDGTGNSTTLTYQNTIKIKRNTRAKTMNLKNLKIKLVHAIVPHILVHVVQHMVLRIIMQILLEYIKYLNRNMILKIFTIENFQNKNTTNKNDEFETKLKIKLVQQIVPKNINIKVDDTCNTGYGITNITVIVKFRDLLILMLAPENIDILHPHALRFVSVHLCLSLPVSNSKFPVKTKIQAMNENNQSGMNEKIKLVQEIVLKIIEANYTCNTGNGITINENTNGNENESQKENLNIKNVANEKENHKKIRMKFNENETMNEKTLN